MHPGRVDVIGAGALILDRVLTQFRLHRRPGQRARHPRRNRLVDRGAAAGPRPVNAADGAGPVARAVAAAGPASRGARSRGASRAAEPGTKGGHPARRRREPAGPVIRRLPPPRWRAGPRDVRDLAASAPALDELTARQSVCRACPRLVSWREEVAAVRRRSFQAERYWGRPIPGWGAADPRVLIVGLAPAAHGGNRTGRIFTGDRSGDFLFASLYRCGLADSPLSVTAGDGQRLRDARMVAAVRCAPPANKPTTQERDTCAPWLVAELALVSSSVRVIVCLGGFAWQALWPVLRAAGFRLPARRPPFGHGWRPRSSRRTPRPRRCCSWAATTRASRTRSPAASPPPCSMTSSTGPAGFRAWEKTTGVPGVVPRASTVSGPVNFPGLGEATGGSGESRGPAEPPGSRVSRAGGRPTEVPEAAARGLAPPESQAFARM